MKEMPKTLHKPLPQSLRDQFGDFRSQLWKRKIVEASISGTFGLLLGYLAVFSLDRFIETSPWTRLGILLTSVSIAVIVVPRVLTRWIWNHRTLEQLAILIRHHDPRYGDRLLGAVELQHQDDDASVLSPELRDAAIAQLAQETTERDLDEALPRRVPGLLILSAVVALIATIGTIFWSSKAASTSLTRWVTPFGDTERYTFTKLEDDIDTLVVPHGEPFTKTLVLSNDTENTPDLATASVDHDAPFSVNRRKDRYTFRFNGLTHPAQVRFDVGDAKRTLDVRPLTRPAVEEIFAELSLPDYLGYPNERLDISNGTLSALAGSVVKITGSASRELDEVTFTLADGATSKGKIDGRNFALPAPLTIEASPEVDDEANAVAGAQTKPTSPTISFTLKDVEKLDGKHSFALTFKPTADNAPTVFVKGQTTYAILVDEDLELHVNASDDFGVRETGMIWQTVPVGEETSPNEDGIVLIQGHPRRRNIQTPFMFSPKDLALSPQRLILRAYVTDYLPERPRQFSEPIYLTILSHDEHARLVKERFGALMDELEELSRSEEAALEENRRLDALPTEQMSQPETTQRIEDQTAAEQSSGDQMEELEKKSRELFKEALRNKTIEPDALKEWSEMNSQLKELGKQDIPEVTQSLQQSSQEDKSNSEKDKSMSEAVEKQKEVLEKMKSALEQANRTEEKLEAAGFVARLRAAAKKSREIASAMVHVVTRSLSSEGVSVAAGVATEDLAKDIYLELIENSKLQDNIRRSVGLIEDDLGHFARRTSEQDYAKIQSEMRKSQIRRALETLKIRIADNQVGRSVPEIKRWADQLDAWADIIDPSKNDDKAGGGGEGGGGASQPPDLAQIELMAELMRMIQEEQDIRAKTRYLDDLNRRQKGLPTAEEEAAARPIPKPKPTPAPLPEA